MYIICLIICFTYAKRWGVDPHLLVSHPFPGTGTIFYNIAIITVITSAGSRLATLIILGHIRLKPMQNMRMPPVIDMALSMVSVIKPDSTAASAVIEAKRGMRYTRPSGSV